MSIISWVEEEGEEGKGKETGEEREMEEGIRERGRRPIGEEGAEGERG